MLGRCVSGDEDMRLLSQEIISDNIAKSSENIMRNRVPPLQNSKNLHAKMAALPPFFDAIFSSFGGVELDFS